MYQGIFTVFVVLSWPMVFLIFWLITFIKKRKQFGKTWNEYVLAKVKANDKDLICYACGNDIFAKREALLNTTWIMFFKFGFWNRSGACYVCSNCSHIHWFVESKNHKVEIVQKVE